MAKNWTMAEAIKAIAEQNMEDVKDIYKRFPTFAMMATRAVGGDNEAACNIIASLPEWATVNKFEKAIKNDVETTEEATDDEQEDVTESEEEESKAKPTKKAKTEKTANKADGEKKLSSKEAWALISKAGRAKDLAAKGYKVRIADMLEYLEKYPIESNDEAVDEGETEIEAEVKDEYADKSPMELFKECKKAGIKAAPKKSKEYYVNLLNEAKATNNDDDDDDWVDVSEPEVEEKPKKTKAEKKPAKKAKPAPKVEEDEDDDEDWDI